MPGSELDMPGRVIVARTAALGASPEDLVARARRRVTRELSAEERRNLMLPPDHR